MSEASLERAVVLHDSKVSLAARWANNMNIKGFGWYQEGAGRAHGVKAVQCSIKGRVAERSLVINRPHPIKRVLVK